MFPKLDQFLQSEIEMASSKSLVYSNLLRRSLRPVTYSGLFNTNAVRQYEDVDDDGNVDRRSDPVLYSLRDLSPFSGSRNHSP